MVSKKSLALMAALLSLDFSSGEFISSRMDMSSSSSFSATFSSFSSFLRYKVRYSKLKSAENCACIVSLGFVPDFFPI